MNNEVWERGSVSIAVRLGPRLGSEVQIEKLPKLVSWDAATSGRRTPIILFRRLGRIGILTRGLLGDVVR